MSDHALLGLLLVGQTIVSAIAISFMALQFRELGKEVQYVAQIAERALNKVERNA
jgi:hypothetical protein